MSSAYSVKQIANIAYKGTGDYMYDSYISKREA